MRVLALSALLVLSAGAARADPAQNARSATAACLSAVIDHAPVGDVDEDEISIRRGQEPVSCTVTVSEGEPVVVRDAVLAAIKARGELFQPAKTRWDPEAFASREAFCNLSIRRNFNVILSTAKPGLRPVAVATVVETPKRDLRCDRDEGVQTVAARQSAGPAAEPPQATASTPSAEAPKAKKKRGLHLPHLSLPGHKD